MLQPLDLSRFPDLPPEVVAAFAAQHEALEAARFEALVERAARQHEQAVVARKEAFIAELKELMATLECQIQQYRRAKFGPKSEKLDPAQLDLALEDLETAIAETEARIAAVEEKIAASTLDPEKAPRKPRQARVLPVDRAARHGLLAGGTIEGGQLRADRLGAITPSGADGTIFDLHRRMPEVRITDLLLDVDEATGFTDAFTDLRTGSVCRDRIGLLSAILADGLNLGLKKMAASATTHTHWQLLRIARWHVEDDAYDRALGLIVEAQAALPMARIWGEGLTASSDGQFFPARGTGEATNLVNARLTVRSPASRPTPISPTSSHLSPGAPSRPPPTRRRSPSFSNQWRTMARSSTVSWVTRPAEECASIMPPLVHCCAIPCRAMDTGGFTDHVFAACSIPGYTFAPRIRDLPDKRLYAFEPNAAPCRVRPLIAARVRTDLIERNWPDPSRAWPLPCPSAPWCPASSCESLPPARGRTSWPPRSARSAASSLLRWIADADLQRRTQMGLNKGEAHHALKRAISLGRRGEIRDRSSEGQHHRMAGLNLLAAAVIHWNTRQLGHIVRELDAAGQPPDPALLAHVSPLGWEHILLTREYRWRAKT